MSGKLRSEDLRVVSSREESEGDAAGALAKPDRTNLAVEIRGATLQYPIGPYVRGSLKASLFNLFGRRESVPTAEYVDAFRSLDLTITAGERVGIIGSNGSGKSSLLRALAGVYPLQSGEITVVGQIGTLLDIGLGFESESTGRENIYYRGMAMGLSKKEIKTAESAIVEFAGLGDFIDLPMRTYSSGMYIRLGFAVSTQFRPDVLLIDEVFAAGDAAFADKAVQRMMGIVSAAGIVIMASHDLALIGRVCNRVLWLNRGRVARDGPPGAVIPQFEQFMRDGHFG